MTGDQWDELPAEPDDLADRLFFEFVGSGGLPAHGTLAGKAGPCPQRPSFLRSPTSLILTVEEAWRTPYPRLTCEHVRTLLEQKMALAVLAEPILEFAERHPLATISNYPGEVGLLILAAADEFLIHAPIRFRKWLQGDFGWMDDAFGWSRRLAREAEQALAAARARASLR